MLEITNHGEVREIRLARPPVNPVAAAITGHSPAGGAVICLMCDYRVMSRGDYGMKPKPL